MNSTKFVTKTFALSLQSALLTLWLAGNAYALEPAQGEVLLTIDGNIGKSNALDNDKPIAEFDLEMLKSFGETTLSTKTCLLYTSDAADE